MHALPFWLIFYIRKMSFPAQMQVNPEPTFQAPPELNIDKIVRLRCQALKETGQPRLKLLRQYAPINRERYVSLKDQLASLLANLKEGDSPAIEQFYPLIFGVLEGSSGLIDPMLLLVDHFGVAIENLKIEELVKEKTKVLNYGVDKRKEMSVRETTDKQAFKSLTELYDAKEIRSHRKVCQGIRNYTKALKKFVKSVDGSEGPISMESQAYIAFVDFTKEELEFNKLKMPLAQTMVEEDNERQAMVDEKEVTPVKEKKEEKKEDTASTHKNKDKEEKEKEEKEAGQGSDDKAKNTRIRRTKDEIQRDRILKEQEREAKKKEKEQRERAKLLEKQLKQQEKAEKERLKELEKEKERKAKQEEKEAKEREKQEAKQAKQRQRLQKEAEKQRVKQQKQKKNVPGVSLFNFFKPKAENSSPSKQDAMKDEQIQVKDTIQQSQKQQFLNLIKGQKTPLSECRLLLTQNKMKDEKTNFEPYYVNIVAHKSRLEFSNFLVTEERFQNYTLPHEETEAGKYEDSSAEYEDLCGDVCDEMDAMSAQEDQSQDNSAIVPDSYFSVDELSEESKDDVVVNIDQGGEWSFSSPDHEKAAFFNIYCLCDQAFPLTLAESEQSSQLSIADKCDLYKQIHGFSGTKDTLIKALSLVTDKVPRSYLDGLIRETTTKKNNQRIIKPEIIEYLNEQKEGFGRELEEIKARRDEEIKLQLKEKMTEKEKEIERLILEEAGTYYIVDLLQFLREKGYRMKKRELSAFIDARVGSHWDDIRRRMKKMSGVKDNLKMNQFLKKEASEKDQKEQKEIVQQNDKSQGSEQKQEPNPAEKHSEQMEPQQ